MSKFKVGDRVRVLGFRDPEDGATGAIVGPADNGDDWMVLIEKGDWLGRELSYGEHHLELVAASPDNINHPQHYKQLPIEAIEITEHFNFCMGNALKYIIRADHKGNPIEDLKKSAWYLEREIERRERETSCNS